MLSKLCDIFNTQCSHNDVITSKSETLENREKITKKRILLGVHDI